MMVDSYLEEFTGVLVNVVDADAASEDADIEADAEVGGEHGETRAVLLQDHLALEEDALGGAAVNLARLTDHDRVVLKMVQNDQLADAVVLEAALNNRLLEVTIKSEHLYIINKFI
jgi:hypothetical protein